MAENVSFDDLIPKKGSQSQEDVSFDDLIPGKAQHPEGTGYYWRTQQKLARGGVGQMAAGLSDIMHPSQGIRGSEPYYVGKGLAQLAGGALGFIASPATAYPALAGQHIEHATGGAIPRAYPEFAMNLALPELGMGRYPALVEEALAARRVAQPPPGFTATIGSRAAEAAQRQGLEIPRAVTSESAPARIASQAVAPIPYLGTPVREAVQAVPQKIASRVEDIAGEWGVEQPKNIVGGGIEQALSKAGKEEATQAAAAKEERDIAAKAAIDEQNAAAQQAWERQHQERQGAIQARQAESEQAAASAFGTGASPAVTATQTINDVQDAHRAGKVAEQAAWREVDNVDAPVSKRFSDNLHGDIEEGLGNKDVTLNPDKTPNAVRMMTAIKKLSSEAPGPPDVSGIPPRMLTAVAKEYGGVDNIPPEVIEQIGGKAGTAGKESDFGLMGQHAPAPGPEKPVSAQGINELRKRVTAMAFKADRSNAEDVRASNAIKSLFEDKVADAFENHMLPGGDPNAHAVIRNAVAETRAFKQRFGYNYGSYPPGINRKAASELNQIATGNAGPTDIAAKLVGGSPGRNEVSHPLYQRILGAVENPGAVRDRFRGTYWREVNHPTPNTAARKIEDLRDSPMGKELFSPQELEQQRAHGIAKQQTELELKRAAEEAKATKPAPIKFKPELAPALGKAETLASKMLGRGRSDEQVYATMDQAAKSDIKNFARTWGRLSEDNRNEFRASWLRQMGGTGEDFNPTQFVKNWDSYSDQAKTIMLGREHRQAMEDFKDILKEYGDNIKKYGNPSGTAQISFYQKLLTGAIKGGSVALTAGLAPFHPVGALMAGVGARQFAKFMARPESAPQVVRWSKLAKAYRNRPNTATFRGLSKMTQAIDKQSQENP